MSIDDTCRREKNFFICAGVTGLWFTTGLTQQPPTPKPALAHLPGAQEFRELGYDSGGGPAHSLDLFVPVKASDVVPVVV